MSLLRTIEAFLISHWTFTLLWMITVMWHQTFQTMHTRLHDRRADCESNDRRSDMTALKECISKRTDEMHWSEMQRMCKSRHWSFKMRRLVKCREVSQNIQSNHDEFIVIVRAGIAVYSDVSLQAASRQIMTEVMRLCITQRQRRIMIMSSIMSSIIIRISVITMKMLSFHSILMRYLSILWISSGCKVCQIAS